MVHVYKLCDRSVNKGNSDDLSQSVAHNTAGTSETLEKPKSVKFNLPIKKESEYAKSEAEIISSAGIQEKFPGFFELPERCLPFLMGEEHNPQSSDGFPPTLKIPSEFFERQNSGIGRKSLFSRAFEELNDPKTHSRETHNILDQQQVDNNQTIKNLEVINPFDDEQKETNNLLHQQTSSRFALTDPSHMDLASKCSKHVLMRQEQQLIKLFDLNSEPNCSNEGFSRSTEIGEQLKNLARKNIEQIKSLYLEEIYNSETRKKGWQFGNATKPSAESAWMMVPIRSVLDAIQRRESKVASADDIQIVELALLWSVFLLEERPNLFMLYAPPNEVFCRIAEVFLMGPEVFQDEIIHKCLSYFTDYLLKMGGKGHISLRLNAPIAGLDAFMPFYEDLLQSFEECSCCEEKFSLILMIPAYMNQCFLDSLLIAQQIWSPQRNIIRQITIIEAKCLTSFLKVERSKILIKMTTDARISEEYLKLMAMYAAALKNVFVTKDRNPLAYEIASIDSELLMHCKQAEFKEVVETLQNSIGDKLLI